MSSGCCAFGPCLRRRKATTPHIETSATAIAKMANDLGFEGHMAWAAEMV